MKARKILSAFLVSTFAFSQISMKAQAQENRANKTVIEEEGEVVFVDITPNHWAYKSLKKLAEEYGIMGGFPDNTFRGNRNLTRYEAAAMLKKLMDKVEDLVAKASKPNYATKADLEQLKKEFTTELEEVQGDIKKLAKDQQDLQKDIDENRDEIDDVRSKLPTVKWNGQVGIRQEIRTSIFDSTKYDVNSTQYRLRLGVSAEKDDFLFGSRLVTGELNDATNQYIPFAQMSSKFPVSLDQLYVSAKPWDGAIDLTLGRHINPFFRKTELLWDEDVTLDGGYLKIKFGEEKTLSLSLYGAYTGLDLDNNGFKPEDQQRGKHTDKSANIMSGGLAATVGSDEVFMFMLAGNYHQYANVNNMLNPKTYSYNKRTNLLSADGKNYISDYNLATASTALTLFPNSFLPISLYGDLSYNLAAGKNPSATSPANTDLVTRAKKEALGLIGGVKLGHLKDAGNILIDYKYKMVGTESAFAIFNEDQLGGTNMSGHEGSVGIQIAPSTSVSLVGQVASKINPEADVKANPYYTIRLGLKHNF